MRKQAQKIGGLGSIFGASGGVFQAPIFDMIGGCILRCFLHAGKIRTPIKPAQGQGKPDKTKPEEATQQEEHGTQLRAIAAARMSEIVANEA